MDISKIDTTRINGLVEELTQLQAELTDQISKVSQPGDICYSLRSEKEGWLLCNGQAVSRTIYQELFATIGTTYGQGDGSTTFNVPDYRGKFLQMVDTTHDVGTEMEAGLPNITGTMKSDISEGSATGCLQIDTPWSAGMWQGAVSMARMRDWSFDASLSNSIYGKSSTVQPPAFMVNYFIKY